MDDKKQLTDIQRDLLILKNRIIYTLNKIDRHQENDYTIHRISYQNLRKQFDEQLMIIQAQIDYNYFVISMNNENE